MLVKRLQIGERENKESVDGGERNKSGVEVPVREGLKKAAYIVLE
jgi:hypothetical protein